MMVAAVLALGLAAAPPSFDDASPMGIDVCVVLARFGPKATATQADAVVDDVAKGYRLTASRFSTPTGRWVAVVPDMPWRARTLQAVAQSMSAHEGVVETYAYLAPRETKSPLEGEAWWRFESGALSGTQSVRFAEVGAWVQWNRRRLTDAEWHQAQAKGHPLAVLAEKVGLPGRAMLEDPAGFAMLAKAPFPKDVGELDLERYTWWVPAGVVAELKQASESKGQSASRLVLDAWRAAEKAKAVAEWPEKKALAGFDPGQKGAEHAATGVLQLYLPRSALDALDVEANARSEQSATLLHAAWRRANPLKPQP